jgi:hypothetical protein
MGCLPANVPNAGARTKEAKVTKVQLFGEFPITKIRLFGHGDATQQLQNNINYALEPTICGTQAPEYQK